MFFVYCDTPEDSISDLTIVDGSLSQSLFAPVIPLWGFPRLVRSAHPTGVHTVANSS